MAERGIVFDSVHLCVLVGIITENLLIQHWCHLVGMCYGAAEKRLDFGDVWLWPLTLELVSYILDKKISHNLKIAGDILVQIYVV